MDTKFFWSKIVFNLHDNNLGVPDIIFDLAYGDLYVIFDVSDGALDVPDGVLDIPDGVLDDINDLVYIPLTNYSKCLLANSVVIDMDLLDHILSDTVNTLSAHTKGSKIINTFIYIYVHLINLETMESFHGSLCMFNISL